ncbi:hypothetical protein ACHWQZ_G005042 [Mnemiopsis leidyi]
MTELELEVVVIENERTNLQPSKSIANDTEPFKKRLASFLWERKKAIVFRIFAVIAIGFDIYSVSKKYSRGHTPWVIVAVVFLLINPIIGGIYSMCCEVLEKSSYNASQSNTKKGKKSYSNENNFKLAQSDSIQGFNDVIVPLNYETDSSNNSLSSLDPKPKKAKKKKVSLMFNDVSSPKAASKQKKLKKGTYVEPGMMDPKMEGGENYIEQISTSPSSAPKLSIRKFLSGVKEHCSLGTVLSHVFLLPKEYQFFYVSKILWRHYKESSNKEAASFIKKNDVKEVSFRPLWNEYIYREIISKQLSLLMAVLQTIPLTFIELLYWSVESEKIATYNTDSENSFFNVKSFHGEEFNIFELASLLINMFNISYRVVSLMNQIRKLNFSKQDMGLLHMIYLTLIYFFLLTSRIISLYFVMCLNVNGIVFTISILCVQFTTTYLVTRNLYAEGNGVTMIISNLLMLFLYVPPKMGRRITMLSYHAIILVEMIALFVFGYCQLLRGNATALSSNHISVVGQDVPSDVFYWFFGSSLAIFLLCWGLNSAPVSKCLFKYREKIDRAKIREVLRDANAKYGTKYEIILGYFGQDKSSFSAQQTIHLF